MGQRSSGFVLGVVVAGLCSAGSIGAGAERADAIPLVVIVHDRAEVLPETSGSGVEGSGPHLLAAWRGA